MKKPMEKIDIKVIKVKRESVNELQLLIEAPASVSEKAYSLSLRDISYDIDVPGFRKGKAPKEVVEKKVGIDYVSRKAFEKVFYEILANAILKEKIDVIDVVEISSYELLPQKPLTFKVIVELRPEVKLGKYKNLKVAAKKTIYDKDLFINKTLEKIANNLVKFRKVNDRPLKEGDQVLIDFEGKFEDGSLVPGGKAENFQTLLEKDKFLPEFVDKLQGAKLNEEREISITFPVNSDQGFSGKKAIFKVKVKSIEEKLIPEINDELSKTLGAKDLNELKEKIDKQRIQMQQEVSQHDLENKIVDEIIKKSKFEISDRMIEREMNYILRDVQKQCETSNIKWDEFKVDPKNKTLFEKAKETAKNRLSIDLVLNAIIKKEAFTVVSDEVDNEIKKRISELGEKYKNLESDSKFRNTVELLLLRNKAVDFLVENNEPLWEEYVRGLEEWWLSI